LIASRGIIDFHIHDYTLGNASHAHTKSLGPGLDNISPSEICAQVFPEEWFEVLSSSSRYIRLPPLQALFDMGWE
jgi:hypothetical protein